MWFVPSRSAGCTSAAVGRICSATQVTDDWVCAVLRQGGAGGVAVGSMGCVRQRYLHDQIIEELQRRQIRCSFGVGGDKVRGDLRAWGSGRVEKKDQNMGFGIFQNSAF